MLHVVWLLMTNWKLWGEGNRKSDIMENHRFSPLSCTNMNRELLCSHADQTAAKIKYPNES